MCSGARNNELAQLRSVAQKNEPLFPSSLWAQLSLFPVCRLFTRFDKLVDHHRVQKVETAGDCYIVACGLLADDGEGFFRIQVGVEV